MKKKTKVVIFTTSFILIAIMASWSACTYIIQNFSSQEWNEDIGTFESLEPTPIYFDLLLPSKYGYKDIRMIMSDVAEKYLSIEVNITVENKSNSAMHVVSQGHFIGKLDVDRKAKIFSGSLKELIDLYKTGDAPRIANKKDNEKIIIGISSNEIIVFPSSVKLYAYAADSL